MGALWEILEVAAVLANVLRKIFRDIVLALRTAS